MSSYLNQAQQFAQDKTQDTVKQGEQVVKDCVDKGKEAGQQVINQGCEAAQKACDQVGGQVRDKVPGSWTK